MKKNFCIYFDDTVLIQPKNSYLLYIYDEVKTPLRFSFTEDVELKKERHLLQQFDQQAVWISHIESSYCLVLKKIDQYPFQNECDVTRLLDLIGMVDEKSNLNI
jgi:hypothetical protein